MAKRPDDNDRAQRGQLGGYLDGVAAVESLIRPEPAPPPASGPVPRLHSAEEATAAIRAALRSPAVLLLLRTTPGAGKSAESLGNIRDNTRANTVVAVFVPTHKLGEQTEEALAALRVDSTRPVGVARVRLRVLHDQAEAPACLHAEAAELAAVAGVHVRQEMCVECPHREAYNGQEGAGCPAYAAGADKAAVAVLQQALISKTLADYTRRLASTKPSKKPPAKLVFIDEPPPLATHNALENARRQWEQTRLSAELIPNVREVLEPALLAVLEAAERGAGGLSLQEILALDGAAESTVERELGELRDLDGAELWRDDLPERLSRRALAPATRDRALERLAAVARFTSLMEAIVDAAHAPKRPALRVDEAGACYLTTAARWTRRIGPYIAAGGRVRLLDATAPTDALRAILGESLDVAAIEVEDAPGVTRRVLRWGHAARGRHTLNDRVLDDEVRGPLRRLAELARECGARSVGVLTHKPVAKALRAWLEASPGTPAPAFVPDELAQLVAAGLELLPGHYGAQRGLNLWAGCDVLATLGDPWPNLGASRAEAAALGLKPEAWALEQTRAELLQAWGRARTVHRTSPVLVVHFGSPALAPEPSWAPQWAGVRPERPARGRPRTVTLPLSDPSTWAEERARLGLSRREHAEALGLSWRTYGRKAPREAGETLSGERSEEPSKNTAKEVAHNPPQEVFEVSSDTLLSSSSLIPDYAPPKTPCFGDLAPANTPSTDPPGAPEAPSAAPARATMRDPLDGPAWGASGGRLAPTRGGWGAVTMRAPGAPGGGAWVA